MINKADQGDNQLSINKRDKETKKKRKATTTICKLPLTVHSKQRFKKL